MECFVRDADDTPLLLFLAGPPRGTLRDGQRIRTPARYYKRIDLIARDGQLRSYPAFVAGATWMEMPAGSHRRDVRIERLWYIAAPVILMTIIFAAMNIRTRRKRHARGDRLAASQDHSHDQPGVEVNADLPDDPAAAMAELRRRAQGHHAQD